MESSSGNRGQRILLGLTGGIGIVKSPRIVSLLKAAGFSVRTVMTPAACEMASPLSFEALTGGPAATDTFTRAHPTEIQHISWAEWADAAVIAPTTANTIGKLAGGIADNLLTTMFLALTCPVLIVPAMNTNMLQNPAVQENLQTLISRGMHVMQPATGQLACGTSGPGRMPDPEDIVETLLALVPGSETPLCGVPVLVTAGPTREAIDPVRYLSNRSSGKMGYALAEAARDMGADVVLISGPVALSEPSGIKTVHVTTAEEMRNAALSFAAAAQIVIGCAAVADYRPAETAEEKLPKSEERAIRLVKTPDILAELGQDKRFFLVGFAAQTHDLLGYAEKKLIKKNLDMIIANDVSGSASGMESDYNEVVILGRGGSRVEIPRAPKKQIARDIMREIASAWALEALSGQAGR